VQVLRPDDAPLNQIIMGCSAMVTDYSSAVWDAVYQGKPALFFQFDRPLYMEKTGSYIDFETELPGAYYLDAQSLIEGLRKTIENGFVPTADEVEAASRWYAHRDKNNCKRIYECAREIERTL
jgi:CDP-glycerol glycerophosphotransferase (TagB/SpsB family)